MARGTLLRVLPGRVVDGLSSTYGGRVGAVPAVAVLLSFRWWAPLPPLIGAVLVFHLLRWQFQNVIKGWTRDAEHLRRAEYFRDLAVTPPAAKEMRIFGLSNWAAERFGGSWYAVMAPVWRERWWITLRAVVVMGLVIVGAAVVIVAVARAAVAGEVAVGDVVLVASLTFSIIGAGTYENPQIFALEAASGLARLEAAERAPVPATAAITGGERIAADLPTSEIRFENVWFGYPGTEREVLRGLDLAIAAGSSVAIVGVNGAGKTTLVKLLARLYDPDRGRILVDGVDVREFDVASWRGRVSAIFQDFARWELSLRDNVAFGAPARLADTPAIGEALRRAQADELLDREGDARLETILSPGYEGGTELSGGQWQRVALARALLSASDGGVLVLDEPTANLDVRAEAKLFERLLDVTRGTTTLLISHRFSTVRRADRIVLISEGRVAEDGTHDELVARDGAYASMYRLQAEQFAAQEAPNP